jgi:hypothetical protein
VSGQLDFLVAPLGGAIVTRDQARPMDTAEIAVDERVPRLGLVRRALGETKVPLGVFVPRVRLQERVLGVGARLYVSPVAPENVLTSLDELPRMGDRAFVDCVRGDGGSLTENR